MRYSLIDKRPCLVWSANRNHRRQIGLGAMASGNRNSSPRGSEIGDVSSALRFFGSPFQSLLPTHVHVEFGSDADDQSHFQNVAIPGVHVRIDEAREQRV